MRSISPARTAAVAVLLLAAAACSKKADQRQRPPVPVSVTRVRKADVPYTIEANGTVTPLQASTVTSQVAGVIQRVAFREGQDVAQGQVLFEIDARPYRAAYQQAAANLQRDRANAAVAARETERYGNLAEQGYVTREQADQQRATAAATAATVSATQAQVEAAKFNLDNTVVRAPISGRTGSLLMREGNVVNAQGSQLVVINQVSPILVRFAIPATQLPLLQRYGSGGGLDVVATPNSGSGSVVDTSTNGAIGLSMGGDAGNAGQGGGPPGSAGANAGAAPRAAPATSALAAVNQPEHGTLFFIDNAVDTTTGTVLLKASFPNPNKRLWAGEFVSAQLRLFVEQSALVVPTQAVVTGQQGPYVYVISDSGTAQQRPVTVERTAGSLSVIAAGLRDGEQIVTEGQSRLTPNAKVSINTPQGVPVGGGGRRGRGAAGAGGAGAAGAGAGGAGAPSGGAAGAATPNAGGSGRPGAGAAGGGRRGAGAASGGAVTPAPGAGAGTR